VAIFTRLYDVSLRWANHRHASWYLGGLSFAESSFFPVPPDVMLAPMCIAENKKAWRFALIATIMSTLGGLFGYLIGAWGFNIIEPILHNWGYWEKFELAQRWFNEWGIWVVFIAGFSPIPYKVFTIAAGVAGMALLPFILASLIGRGARFFIVAGVIRWGGKKMETMLRQYIEYLGWLLVVLLVVLVILKY